MKTTTTFCPMTAFRERQTMINSPCGIFVKFAFNLFLIIWPPTSLIVLSQNVRL